MPKHFLTVRDYTGEQIFKLLQAAREIKRRLKAGEEYTPLKGKTLAMIFQKPSNRTRVSFEVGMYQLGGHALMLKEEEIGMGTRETVPDVSRVLSRYVDAAMIRPFYHSDVVDFARASSVPVINGLSDLYHPCQACADMLTILEHKGRLEGIKLCYIGDGNNVANSLIAISARLGVNLSIATPKGYEPTIKHDRKAYTVTNDPAEAVAGADVIYTDVWVSMGPPGQEKHGLSDFVGYTVDSELMKLAASDAIFMHCLPAHRGEEVSAEVMDSEQSVVFDQAENRLHAQKAILTYLMSSEFNKLIA